MTTIPEQILGALPVPVHASDVLAWAPIGSAPGTSMGETHLVVTAEQCFALSRQRPWDKLAPLALAPHVTPTVDATRTETWLLLPLATGGDLRVPLTLFDRDGVDKALAEIGQRRSETAFGPPLAAENAHIPPAAATLQATPRPTQTPLWATPAGDDALADRIDQALSAIELAGLRASLKAGINAADVTATVRRDDGDLEIRVRYDRSALARLASQAGSDDAPE